MPSRDSSVNALSLFSSFVGGGLLESLLAGMAQKLRSTAGLLPNCLAEVLTDGEEADGISSCTTDRTNIRSVIEAQRHEDIVGKGF
jgi:hypothetical protein